MDKENLWGVCEHVLAGSANEVLLRRGKIALCKRCAIDLPTERIQTVYESEAPRPKGRGFCLAAVLRAR